MKSLGSSRFIWAIGLIFVAALAPRPAWAFGESEDQLFAADVREARARAKDFYAQKQREAAEDVERQRGAEKEKADQAAFEAREEKLRELFVKERNEKPSVWLEQARLERLSDQQQIAEEKQMDRNRREYKKKRQRVERLIQKEAHIDENEEYGL